MMIMTEKTKKYLTAAIAIIVVVAARYSTYMNNKTVQLSDKLSKAQQTTDAKIKEVKTLEKTYTIIQKQNDYNIQTKVEEAYNNVPDDLDDLISLANSLIRCSNQSGRVNSSDVQVGSKDLDN